MSHCVLVSGANGFIGRRLCAALRARGDRVVALLRDAPRAPGPWHEWRRADLALPLADDIACGADVVCHLAAVVHARGADQALYERINAEGTRRLVDAAKRAGASQFVFFSSIKAAGETTSGCVDERQPARPETAYGRSKLAAEAVLSATDGIASRIRLRLCPVYGEKMAGSLRLLLHAVERGWLPPLPAVENRRSFVHVDDVVTAVLALIARRPRGDLLAYVSDGAPLSTPRIVALARAAAGRRPPRLHAPLWPWRLLAVGGERLGAILGRPSPFDRNRYRALFADACYANTRLRELVGWTPTWTLERFLREDGSWR